MQKKCKISIKDFEIIVELNSSKTAEEIWNCLPLSSNVNTWGNEIFFYTNVSVELDSYAKDVVELGEIVYWPAGKAIAIGFGKTPASINEEIRLASKCNVWGTTKFELQKLKDILSNEVIIVTKL